METDMNKYETAKQQMEGLSRSAGATAQNILEQGTEAYGQAQKAVSDVYDKTASSVNEAYTKVKSYSTKNPGKTILVTLGLGIILGAFSSHFYRSRTSRYNGPVVKALSDMVHKA